MTDVIFSAGLGTNRLISSATVGISSAASSRAWSFRGGGQAVAETTSHSLAAVHITGAAGSATLSASHIGARARLSGAL